MKTNKKSLILGAIVISIFGLSACSSSKTSKEKTVESSKVEETTTTESSSEDNGKWYADDSKYATMEPVKKTVDMQMEEIGTDDAIFAITVNELQTYLSNGGNVEIDAKDVASKTGYSIDGDHIVVSYDGKVLPDDATSKIQKGLLNVSGKSYLVISM
ncbi:hypothetical protein [Floricoccus penangensis]|uniref:hypothetical protein n=1 Tax=Floricoccus penangensis TaxID=1859475 RepID=UPI0020426984|nr:hypothetical protein [Floricoccus penangensis]URZ87217.1 hypothetical protein KIW23_09075 [Floricoccus penangensis]